MFLKRGGVRSTMCIHGQLQHLHNEHRKGVLGLQAQLITIRRAKPRRLSLKTTRASDKYKELKVKLKEQ